FAVGVGGQVDGGRVPRRRLQLLDHLLARGQDFVLGLEALLDVDAERLLGQVPDMAHGGLHLEVPPEILVDRLGLRRRLDDHEVLGHEEDASPIYCTRLVTYRRTNSPPGSRRTRASSSNSARRASSSAALRPLRACSSSRPIGASGRSAARRSSAATAAASVTGITTPSSS